MFFSAANTKSAHKQLLTIACCIIAAIFFAYPFIFMPFGSDQAIFAYIGGIINEGGIPYLDAWDVKPPLIYYIYSIALKIGGHSTISLRLCDLLYFFITMLCMYFLGKELYSRKVGMGASLCLGLLYFFTNSYWEFSQCESFMILPMIVSVFFCCKAIKDRKWFLYFGSGFFSGIVFMIKLTGIVILFPVFLYLFCAVYRHDPRRLFPLFLLRFLYIILGVTTSMGIVFLWFYANGGIFDMLYTLFVYDIEHGRSAINLTTDYLHLSFLGFIRRYFFVLFPAIIAFTTKRHVLFSSKNMLLYGWTLSMLLVFFVQGRFYHYHMLPIIAPFSLLGAERFLTLYNDCSWNKKVFFLKKKVVLSLVSAVLIIIATEPQVFLGIKNFKLFPSNDFYNDAIFIPSGGFSLSSSKKVAEYIHKNTSPEDNIIIWGFQPLIYFLSQRKAPTRFFFNTPLIAPFSSNRDTWRKEFLSDIKHSLPKYFIIAEHDEQDNRIMASVNKDSFSVLQNFTELFAFLSMNYQIDIKIGYLSIYKKRNIPERL